MAMQSLSRALLFKPRPLNSISLLFTRSFSSPPPFISKSTSCFSTSPLLNRVRPLAAVFSAGIRVVGPRALSTSSTSSSLNDPSPNWSNRPPKETILLDGCDFEHWLVVLEKPEGDPTRDEIIDSYVKTLALVVGSEDEARKKIYSVSTRCYFAFGALVSEELSYKLKELPKVRWVLPDSYLDVRNKDYGGEPFIDGKAVPYDPKYHEEWIKNNARANERNRRNDRPCNNDRSRNFDRRRENMRGMPPGNQGPNNMGGMPPSNQVPNNMGGMPPRNQGLNNYGGMPPSNQGPNNYSGISPSNQGPNNYSGISPSNQGPNNYGGMPLSNQGPNNMGGMPPSNQGPNNMGGMPPSNQGPNSYGGMPQNNMGRMQPNNMGGMPPNAGWSGNSNQNFETNSGDIQHQGQAAMPNTQYQTNYSPTRDGGNMSGGNPYQS